MGSIPYWFSVRTRCVYPVVYLIEACFLTPIQPKEIMMSDQRIKELESALETIYDMAFSAYIYLKMGIGKPLNQLDIQLRFEGISNLIEAVIPDDDEE